MIIIHITAGIQETCGVSQFVMEIARAQGLAGHSVSVITTMTCGYPLGDVDVRLSPDPVPELERLETKPDVVHVHNLWSRYGHRAMVWCRANRVPYVVSPHGALKAWALKYKWWKKIPALLVYQWGDLHRARAFHVTAEAELPGLRRLHLNQPSCIAPLGVWINPESAANNQPPTVGSSSYRDVLFVGRIHPVKNLDGLIRAWALVREGQRCPPPPTFSTYTTRLIIAGSNDVGHQEELVELAQSLGLKVVDFSRDLEFGKKQIFGGGEVPVETFQKRLKDCHSDVVFTGPVYSAAKDWMFRHAWVSVLPSYSENFGGVVVEALAQGTPVIASMGTPWRMLAERHCGWWVNPTPENLADAVRVALEMTAEERTTMAERARRFVEECYSWKGSAAKVMALYEVVGEDYCSMDGIGCQR